MNINLLKSMFFSRATGWLGLAIHVRSPTSNDHNFLVQTPFRVFLDSMESPLSQNSSHISVEESG